MNVKSKIEMTLNSDTQAQASPEFRSCTLRRATTPAFTLNYKV